MTNNGGPAFPQPGEEYNAGGYLQPCSRVDPGMSLRDYFAASFSAKELPTFHQPEAAANYMATDVPQTDEDAVAFAAKLMARLRYTYADAMLAERERR
jgi:hypothetical protein